MRGMLMLSKMLSEVSNALGQHSYLETGGAGILLVNFEVVDVDFAHITTWFCPARQHLQRPARRAKRGEYTTISGRCKPNFTFLRKKMKK